MPHFIKYFCAALAALLLDYVVTAGCIYMGISYTIALVFGTGLGAIVGFLLLTYVVFPVQKKGSAKHAQAFSVRRVGGFLCGVGLVYAVRSFVMWCWYALENSIDASKDWQYVVLIFSYGCSFITNFLFQKYLVFSQKSLKK